MSRGVKIKRELMSRITVLLFAISNFCKLVDFAMLKKKLLWIRACLHGVGDPGLEG